MRRASTTSSTAFRRPRSLWDRRAGCRHCSSPATCAPSPAPGPLKIRQRAQVIDGGYVDEVCDIWDSSDVLVAQATQLALVRF